MPRKEEPEEYEVERICGHKIEQVGKGKNKKPTLYFHIKWKGYPTSENTWELSDATENAQDLVDIYWETRGGGQSKREDVERELSGKKKSPTPEPAKSKKRVASPFPTKSAVKSKRAKKDSPAPAVEKSIPVFKKAAPVSKAKKIPVVESQDSSSEEEESDVEEEIEINDFRAKSNNWKTDVEKIKSVRKGDYSDELYGVVLWRDGKIGLNKTSLIAQKNPALLIKYYEKRLTFEKK